MKGEIVTKKYVAGTPTPSAVREIPRTWSCSQQVDVDLFIYSFTSAITAMFHCFLYFLVITVYKSS